MTMLAGTKWISCEERNPEEYGKYRVLCVKRGQRTEDDYLWNGSYWVTPGGSPSKGVEAWAEKNAPAVKTETRALTLADYEARIHLYKEQIGTGYIGIGRTLNEAKEAKVVPHGQWESWVTETTGLTPRQAQRCMQAATEIRDGSAMARLEMSKALMLLGSGLDEEAREEIATRAVDEGTTVKQLREELKKAKLQVVQETGAAAEIRDALKKAESERDLLEQQMRATVSAYQTRLDEETEKAYKRGMTDRAERMEKEIREEFQGKIDYINGERRQADERIRDLQERLKDAEKAGSARWDAGYQAGMDQAAEIRREVNEQRTREIDSLQEALDASEKELVGAQNELNKQTQYAADLKRTQAELLAAAEEAEKRAADAEAELEALRAGNGQDRTPVADKVSSAVFQFLSECGYMNDRPEVLQRVDAKSARSILCSVDILQAWCDDVYEILDSVVKAEGAVE